jgi:hypothetical protein
MRTLIFTAAVMLGAASIDARAEDSRHIDVENLFPNVGATIVFVDPNDVGFPPGVLDAGGGAVLIHPQVVLTVGHFTRVSEDGVPPFIHVFVTFNLHVFDDRSTWIPVVAQAWHPSTLPCPHLACNWPTPPLPHFSDVGLLFLARPVNGIKVAELARPGTLESGRAGSQDQIMVGYGPLGDPDSVTPSDIRRRYRVIPSPYDIFDEATAIGRPAESCVGDSGSPTFLGPLGDSGNKRRSVVALTSAFYSPDCRTGRSIVTRIDNEDVQSWIVQEIERFLERK